MSHGRTVVTGATGFVGGRLVEKLVLGHGLPVRCVLRDYSHAARIGRFPVQMRQADLADTSRLKLTLNAAEVVYHCAYDYGSAEVNVAAAEAVVEACAEAGSRRLVFVSTMAVYHPTPAGRFDETAPCEPAVQAYTASKQATEQALLTAAARRGVPAAVVQPTTIYGPYCLAWTLGAAKQLRTGRLVLPRRNIGVCNAVYIDDVVVALILASERDEAVGRRFLVSGPDTVGWHDYYRAYERALGTESLTLWEDDELAAAAGAGAGARARQFRANPKRLLEIPLVRHAYDAVRGWTGQDVWDRMKEKLPAPLHLPDAGLLALYRSQAVADIGQAREQLGYRPRFDFQRGMDLTSAWLRWAGL